MELMTYMERQDAWAPFPSVLQGLRMSRVSSSDLLLVSANPVADIGDLVAFVGLFKVAGGKVDRLGIASSYPSLGWIRAVRAEGIGKVYFSPSCPGSSPCQVSRGGLIEVPRDICPALHVREFDGQATSVCGNKFDRLVLGRRQFTEQCFARWSACRWAIPTGNFAAAASR
jgi:hypothetical protein